MEHVDVKPCDREAVFSLAREDGIFKGSNCFYPASQAFARHRIATEARHTAALEQAREALDFIANVGRITPGFSELAVRQADEAQAAINDKLGDG